MYQHFFVSHWSIIEMRRVKRKIRFSMLWVKLSRRKKGPWNSWKTCHTQRRLTRKTRESESGNCGNRNLIESFSLRKDLSSFRENPLSSPFTKRQRHAKRQRKMRLTFALKWMPDWNDSSEYSAIRESYSSKFTYAFFLWIRMTFFFRSFRSLFFLYLLVSTMYSSVLMVRTCKDRCWDRVWDLSETEIHFTRIPFQASGLMANGCSSPTRWLSAFSYSSGWWWGLSLSLSSGYQKTG